MPGGPWDAPDPDGLPRPVVTLDGAPPPAPPSDLLASGGPEAPATWRDRLASVLSTAREVPTTARAVLTWQPRRDLLRPLVAAAAAVLVTASASAVALELRDPSLEPDEVLAATLAARQYRVELTTEVLAAPDGGTDLGLGGLGEVTYDVDLDRDASRFALSPVDGHVRLEVVVIGDDTWTRFERPDGFGVPDADGLASTDDGPLSLGEERWLRSDTDESRQLGLGTDGGLRRLLEQGRLVERLDATTVDGVEVSEVVVGLAPPTEGDDALVGEDEEVRARMAVDGDGRLRRLVVEQEDADTGRTRSTLTVSRFGVDPRIEPPPAELVSDGTVGPFGS